MMGQSGSREMDVSQGIMLINPVPIALTPHTLISESVGHSLTVTDGAPTYGSIQSWPQLLYDKNVCIYRD